MLFKGGLCEVNLVGFDEAAADFLALGERESVRHRAPYEHGVALVEKGVYYGDFVGDFRPAEYDGEGAVGIFRFGAEEFELFFYEQARHLNRKVRGDSRGRRMRPVGCAESVVDIGFRARVLRELLGEFGVVFFSSG